MSETQYFQTWYFPINKGILEQKPRKSTGWRLQEKVLWSSPWTFMTVILLIYSKTLILIVKGRY